MAATYHGRADQAELRLQMFRAVVDAARKATQWEWSHQLHTRDHEFIDGTETEVLGTTLTVRLETSANYTPPLDTPTSLALAVLTGDHVAVYALMDSFRELHGDGPTPTERVAAERERCAKVAEEYGRGKTEEANGESLLASQSLYGEAEAATAIADAIRAGG